MNQLCLTSLFTKRERSLIFSGMKKSSFLKSMILLKFWNHGYSNILNLKVNKNSSFYSPIGKFLHMICPEGEYFEANSYFLCFGSTWARAGPRTAPCLIFLDGKFWGLTPIRRYLLAISYFLCEAKFPTFFCVWSEILSSKSSKL